MRPHWESWGVSLGDPALVINEVGTQVLIAADSTGVLGLNGPRAKLAAQAPAMARLLRRIAEGGGVISHTVQQEAFQLLDAAGVIE